MERTYFPFLIKYPLPDLPPRGGPSVKNSPVGYFSEGARLWSGFSVYQGGTVKGVKPGKRIFNLL